MNLCLKWIYDNLAVNIVLVDHLQKTKKEYKNVSKQEVHDLFLKIN